MKKLFLLAFSLSLIGVSAAQIQSKPVSYKEGKTQLEGFLVYDDAKSALLPGIVVVHAWMGPNDEVKVKAQQLVELGYVAFVADIYGKKVRPTNPQEAGAAAGIYKKDRKLYRARLQAALDQLTKQPNVDKTKLGAMGYCFGGTGALEMARAGMPVKGVASFHGSLDGGLLNEATPISAKVLAMHGADDPHVPAKDVEAFENEMRTRKADWLLVKYGNAVHSFTEKAAGNDNSKGTAYNEAADKRSWQELTRFFAETFHGNAN